MEELENINGGSFWNNLGHDLMGSIAGAAIGGLAGGYLGAKGVPFK